MKILGKMLNFRAKGINNTSYKTWNDIIHKERDTRLKWNIKYNSSNNLDNELDWQAKQNKIDFETHLKRQKFSVPESQNGNNLPKLKEALLSRIKLREPSPEEKSLLYEGISRDFQGRWKYLDARKKYRPEEKYHFPVTSSMVYGWRQYDENNRRLDSLEGTEIPSKHGIKNLVINTFYRENGVFFDANKENEEIKIRKE